MLYACQDVDFDRGQGLSSMPVRFAWRGLAMAAFAHADAALFFLLPDTRLGFRVCTIWAGVCAVVLLVENRLIAEDDLSRINVSFFTLNGVIAALLGLATIVSVFWLVTPGQRAGRTL